MRFVPLPRLAVVTLASVALSLVSLAGAHLHLCFDGLEPPVTLHHLADVGPYPDHHSPERDCSDPAVELDVGLRGVPKDGTHAPAITPSVAHVAVGVRCGAFLCTVDAPAVARTIPRFRQPPLRAPPA
jgi:hypothetical protein